MSEKEQRDVLVYEALSWERTPFQHGQCVKGVAADCSTFLATCYRAVGIFRADIEQLPSDWFLHTSKESYLNELQKHATEFDSGVRTPQPGDIMIVKDTAIGARVFSHGCIVVEWPIVIHCFPPCVMRSNALAYPAFQNRKLKFFNPWVKPNA